MAVKLGPKIPKSPEALSIIQGLARTTRRNNQPRMALPRAIRRGRMTDLQIAQRMSKEIIVGVVGPITNPEWVEMHSPSALMKRAKKEGKSMLGLYDEWRNLREGHDFKSLPNQRLNRNVWGSGDKIGEKQSGRFLKRGK